MNGDKYLVIGNPVAHSLSPQIHAAFAKETHQILTYDRLCVEPEYFFDALENFFSHCGKGANITAPFKSMAFECTQDHCSEAAKLAKAVNTLSYNAETNILYGDNTDGIGLLRDLKRLNWSIAGKKLLILGTGGAVRGILPALLSEKPASITLYNRTPEKISVLIREFQFLGTLLPVTTENEHKDTYDIVFNAIPSAQVVESDFWTWLPQTISSYFCAYDLSYSQKKTIETPFIAKMKQIGCQKTADGFGMLLEQAAESFFIWRGIRPKNLILTRSYYA